MYSGNVGLSLSLKLDTSCQITDLSKKPNHVILQNIILIRQNTMPIVLLGKVYVYFFTVC